MSLLSCQVIEEEIEYRGDVWVLAAIDWRRDQRSKIPNVYVVPPNDAKNRINRFMSAWQACLDNPETVPKTITWGNPGRIFASVLGDVPHEKKRHAVCAILLYQYVHSSRRETNRDRYYFKRRTRAFNGYEYHGSFKECAEIAKDHRDTTLTDLRTCLFFEQRIERHRINR